MWLLAVLTGDRIKDFFLYIYKEMYGRFAGLKTSGRNIYSEVTVSPGWL